MCAGETAVDVQWEPLCVTRGRPVHGAAGEGAEVSQRNASLNNDIQNLPLCFSYEEQLKTMVLREEFFPFVEEVKSSITAMIKGANGNVLSIHTPTPVNLFYPPVIFPNASLFRVFIPLKSCWTVMTSTRSSGSS